MDSRHSLTRLLGKIGFRLPATLVTIIAYCVPVYLIIWPLALADDLSFRIFMTVLVTLLPVCALFSDVDTNTESARWLSPRFWGWPMAAWFVVSLLYMSCLVAIGDQLGLSWLGTQASLGVLAVPWLFGLAFLVRYERLLLPGLLSAFLVALACWAVAISVYDETWELLPIPVIVMTFCWTVWAPLAIFAVKWARDRKDERVIGPLAQALAMAALFIPAIFVAGYFPPALGLSPTWIATFLLVVSFVISAVIAEPLRKFMLEWGRLDEE